MLEIGGAYSFSAFLLNNFIFYCEQSMIIKYLVLKIQFEKCYDKHLCSHHLGQEIEFCLSPQNPLAIFPLSQLLPSWEKKILSCIYEDLILMTLYPNQIA